MQISKIDKKNFFLMNISPKEMQAIQKILQKTLEVISDREFKVRTGFAKAEVERLISTLKDEENRQKSQDINNIELSSDELVMLHQLTSETCHGFYVPNFQHEIGLSKEWAVTYKYLIREIIRSEYP